MKTNRPVYFITGIDTDVGKTYATGLISRYLKENKIKYITQKPIESGVENGISADILKHRELANDLNNSTHTKANGHTSTYLFKYPASPHLAAKLENITIDENQISKATNILMQHFDTVLIEGAGGLFVPWRKGFLTIDFIQQHNFPVIIVTSAKLGSINHTLMSLELLKIRKIELAGLIFNLSPVVDNILTQDSANIFKEYLAENFPKSAFIFLPFVNKIYEPIDFSKLFFSEIT